MKEIKKLTADWIDLPTMEKNKNIEFRRFHALEKWLEENIPDYIEGKYSFSAIGETCIRVFIDLNKDETWTLNMSKWLPELKKKKWKIEKFWRKESGYFSYRADRHFGSAITYILLFEETANIDGCVIKEKRVMQKIFLTDCETARVEL